jgi:hypothetical protein
MSVSRFVGAGGSPFGIGAHGSLLIKLSNARAADICLRGLRL